ncbi:hypothetical protein [Shinella pollutisoli]|uniref:Uncharacterized protein n=1 Tax=Shinella pollutisoli TaxID=2250594 RepID=A0ABV7DJ37_9HYPH|nr:hypothetical protein [Shinella pollutisoli]
MSIIAYRNGVIAADTGGWVGDAKHPFSRKITIGADGTLYGTIGHAPECARFIEWVETGRPGPMPMAEKLPGQESSFVVMVVSPGGLISLISAWGEEPLYTADYFAIGGAAAVALGALHAGADAYGAVQAAIVHSSSATGSIHRLSRPRPGEKA